MKFNVRSPKSEVWCSKSGRGPKSEVGVWHLKSVRSLYEVCHKAENCLHDADPHWSAVLLILITYIIMYFLSLFGYISMFVFVWQINCLSLWVRSLTSVRCLTMKAAIRRLKYVRSPQSEVWKLMSKVHNRESNVRSLKLDVRGLSENCLNYVQSLKYYVRLFKTWSPKTKVWSPKYVQSLKSVSCLSLKLKSNAQNLMFEVESLKWKVYLKNYFRPSQIFISPFFKRGLLYYNLIRRSYYQNI